MASNSITGQLPGEWVSLKVLRSLDVSANNITGTVPTIWQAFGGATYKLQCLLLHSNPDLNKAFPGAPDSIKNNLKVVTSPGDTCLAS
jgi:predicted deacylase